MALLPLEGMNKTTTIEWLFAGLDGIFKNLTLVGFIKRPVHFCIFRHFPVKEQRSFMILLISTNLLRGFLYGGHPVFPTYSQRKYRYF